MMLLCLLFQLADLASAQLRDNVTAETPAIRNYFYVGGGYSEDGRGGHIFKDQMYVEQLSPINPRHNDPSPIVFIHGQGQTGTNFLNKPDGGISWTSHFLDAGYTVYIIDQTFRGRSAWTPGSGAQTPSTYSAEIIQQRFTAPRQYELWPQAELHTQWPGRGRMGDPTFDAFYRSQVQFQTDRFISEEQNAQAYSALVDLVGDCYIISHSQAGAYGIFGQPDELAR